MIIRRATNEDVNQLYEFNHQMYPERKNYKEIVDFWISKSQDAISDIVIMEEEGRIQGQQFYSSMSYFYSNQEFESSWAFDLIVDETLRAGSQGFALMWKCKKIHPNNMSSGSNDTSLPINLKIGNKHIGDLKKFVGIGNPFWLLTSFFRGEIKRDKFPIIINDFCLLDENSLPNLKVPFNKDLLEISRKNDFLKWRYFSNLHDYAIYKKNHTNDFFVVRTIVKNHITALVLIDYRCNFHNDSSISDIFKAFKNIARKMKLSMLIVGSSLKVVDQECTKAGFKSIGRDRPILGLINCEDAEQKRSNRNFVCVTLADSDGDITW